MRCSDQVLMLLWGWDGIGEGRGASSVDQAPGLEDLVLSNSVS